MTERPSRRDVTKSIAAKSLVATSLAGMSLLGATARRVEAAVPATDPLQAFDYSGVHLRDGMLRNQTLYARDLFLRIRDDDLLHGFRARAGRPAPGTSLGGWYGIDLFHAFGQYVSGMARLAKALGDVELGNKAKRLVHEWGKTIGPKGPRKHQLRSLPQARARRALSDVFRSCRLAARPRPRAIKDALTASRAGMLALDFSHSIARSSGKANAICPRSAISLAAGGKGCLRQFGNIVIPSAGEVRADCNTFGSSKRRALRNRP
jgi:hypothetical protein